MMFVSDRVERREAKACGSCWSCPTTGAREAGTSEAAATPSPHAAPSANSPHPKRRAPSNSDRLNPPDGPESHLPSGGSAHQPDVARTTRGGNSATDGERESKRELGNWVKWKWEPTSALHQPAWQPTAGRWQPATSTWSPRPHCCRVLPNGQVCLQRGGRDRARGRLDAKSRGHPKTRSAPGVD